MAHTKAQVAPWVEPSGRDAHQRLVESADLAFGTAATCAVMDENSVQTSTGRDGVEGAREISDDERPNPQIRESTGDAVEDLVRIP